MKGSLEPVDASGWTLEIELEDVGERSWWQGVLATAASQGGSALSRFVGNVHLNGTVVESIESDTFVRPRSVRDDVPPEAAWAPDMTAALDGLRRELLAAGWTERGRGAFAWSYRFAPPPARRR